jgi:hypothetical protein
LDNNLYRLTADRVSYSRYAQHSLWSQVPAGDATVKTRSNMKRPSAMEGAFFSNGSVLAKSQSERPEPGKPCGALRFAVSRERVAQNGLDQVECPDRQLAVSFHPNASESRSPNFYMYSITNSLSHSG